MQIYSNSNTISGIFKKYALVEIDLKKDNNSLCLDRGDLIATIGWLKYIITNEKLKLIHFGLNHKSIKLIIPIIDGEITKNNINTNALINNLDEIAYLYGEFSWVSLDYEGKLLLHQLKLYNNVKTGKTIEDKVIKLNNTYKILGEYTWDKE